MEKTNIIVRSPFFILIDTALTFLVRGTTPKKYLEPFCETYGADGYSITELNMIILCPSIIRLVRSELQSVKNVDHFDPTSNLDLENMRSISTVMLHEILHIAFDNWSKCTS